MARRRYREWLVQVAPSWLQGPWGARWLEALGLALDQVADAADAAAKVALPAKAPADALPWHGEERSIARAPADTEAAYRARLDDAWNLWEFGGTEQGLIAALQPFLPDATITILANRDWPDTWGVGLWGGDGAWGDGAWGDAGEWGGGVWGWDPPDHVSGYWSRFWVLLEGATWTVDVWGGGSAWDDAGTWGSSATPAEVATLRALVRKWKSADEICAGFVVALGGGDLWWPTAPWAGGVWGGQSITWPGM